MERIELENQVRRIVEKLEQDRLLREPVNLLKRFEVLDEFDAYLSDERLSGTRLHESAMAVCSELEMINSKLYEDIRHDILSGAGTKKLLQWAADLNRHVVLANSSGYDYLDELIGGVLQFDEPLQEGVRLESEMVAYQPTPARHIFDFIMRAELAERDFLFDLGSGLGHVTLMASICTSAHCTGIELEPSYVECARKSARSLNLKNVRFIEGDARATDFSGGTVFYLYTPFTGTILRKVLDLLRHEACKREIRICTFGPCTRFVAEEQWLNAVEPHETERAAIFRSCKI